MPYKPSYLQTERDERKRLEKALALNKPLATVYYMKEHLRQFWDQQNKQAAEPLMNDWIARAQSSGIRMLEKFAVTLAEHRSGILAYYDCRITTAALEGTNNKIKPCWDVRVGNPFINPSPYLQMRMSSNPSKFDREGEALPC